MTAVEYDSDANMPTESDYADWYETEQRELTRLGIKAAFWQRGSHHHGHVGRVEGWWLFCKLLICVLFGWRKPSPHHQRDDVTIGLIHHTPTYAGWDEDWIEVGRGVFREWWFSIEHDSEWNM